MNRAELETRLNGKSVEIREELLDKILGIKNFDDFNQFIDFLVSYKLGNDEEYEYYNAGYLQLFGEESDAYKGE